MRGTPKTFLGFTGGVNLLDAPYLLADKEARDARNVVSTNRGAIKKRPGAQTFVATAAQIKGLFAGENPKILLATSASVIYKITSGAVITSLKTGLSNSPWEWIQANPSGGQGPFFGMNGVDAPQYYDGAAAATVNWTAAVGAVPNGKYILYANNRVWVASGDRVFWSNVADPRDWPAANVAQFGRGDGEDITGIGTVGPYILVFKSNKCWVIYDLDTGANRRIGDGIGCVAHRSIVETPAGTIFLSEDQGVMSTDGAAFKRLSDRIKPLLEDINQAKRSEAAGAFINDHYYLSFSTGGVNNDVTVDLDMKLDAWWVHTLAEQDFAIWEPATIPQLYGAKAGAQIIDRCFVDGETADNAAAFDSYWKGPYHPFGSPHLRKRCRAIHFDGKGRINVGVSRAFAIGDEELAAVDFSGSDGTFGVDDGGLFGVDDAGIFGGLVAVQEAKIPTPGVARAWSIIFGNDTTDDFEVESYTMAMQTRRN